MFMVNILKNFNYSLRLTALEAQIQQDYAKNKEDLIRQTKEVCLKLFIQTQF